MPGSLPTKQTGDSVDATELNNAYGLIEESLSRTSPASVSAAHVYGAEQQYNAGIDVRGDIVDGSTTLYDRSKGVLRPTHVDHYVDSVSELQNLFPSGLSDGDTVLIAGENAPYRTTQHLDINNSNVTVIGSSALVDIKVASGGDVGGFRIGQGTSVSNVHLHRIGYDGNYLNQDQSVKQLHGIEIGDEAERVILTNGYVTRTSPHPEHNYGGSGIRIENAKRCVVKNMRLYDIGDRGIELGGQSHYIAHNDIRLTFDRGISMVASGKVGDETDDRPPSHCSVIGNRIRECTEGTAIRGGQPGNEFNAIIGNVIKGRYKGGINMVDNGGQHNLIKGNTIHHTANPKPNKQNGLTVPSYSLAVGNVVIDDAPSTEQWNSLIKQATSAEVAHNITRTI
jgi:hypothetical protein